MRRSRPMQRGAQCGMSVRSRNSRNARWLPRFYCHMLQLMHGREALPHGIGACRTSEADDRRMRAGADAPDVQVEDAGIAGAFDLVANFLFEMWIGGVEQNA